MLGSISSCSYIHKLRNEHNEAAKEEVKIVEDSADRSAEFVGSSEIPVAEGLILMDDKGIDFDSEDGSISSFTYSNEESAEDIRKFYLEVMPKIGFKLIVDSEGKADKTVVLDKLSFLSSTKKVEINFVKDEDDQDLVKFFISSISQN